MLDGDALNGTRQDLVRGDAAPCDAFEDHGDDALAAELSAGAPAKRVWVPQECGGCSWLELVENVSIEGSAFFIFACVGCRFHGMRDKTVLMGMVLKSLKSNFHEEVEKSKKQF